ncbi:unnamed protein product [Caenorhabditis bovis]|uniref:GRIP domain-containing protein n=1 Tax=Caenorhabditis bovis TaxID=2654633 RepID=A0A8S1EIK8_9PELO|nr:unnamed protein product [Caenorhabditis bovis]
MRAALAFAPPRPWQYFNDTKPSEDELSATPTIKAYYDLREPCWLERSLNSNYLLEHNMISAIAYLDKRRLYITIYPTFRHHLLVHIIIVKMNKEDTSVSADDELPAPSTSQTNGDQQPKKGILKRPSILNEERRDKLTPLAGFRSSPDRFAEKGPTRIPKLVTWWEKNAVAFIGETSDENNTDSEQLMRDLGGGRREGSLNTKPLQIRQTAILDSEDSDMNDGEPISPYNAPDLDDTMSITSSTGSATSAVVGRWWTGKDTRYVPHCQKKGCNHANHSSTGEYITPTQRRNKELAQLKKELRQAIAERDEKEKHLSDLRDKVKEIEIYNEAQNTLFEGQKTLKQEQFEREALEKEKKIMEKKHAVRVNQLIQETMSAREEAVKLGARVAQLEAILNSPKTDSQTQTEMDLGERESLLKSNPPDPSDPNQHACIISQTFQADAPTPVSAPTPQDKLLSGPTSPLIPLMPHDAKGQPIFCSQEVLTHLQACQNEAYIWRNKAAQLEIVAKEQILKIGKLEEEIEKASRKVVPTNIITVTPHAYIVEEKGIKVADTEQELEILATKAELCETLTKQLEEIRRDQSKNLRKQQEERDQYKKSLEEVSLIAEKVPILETQLLNLTKKKHDMELEFKHEKKALEDQLAQMLENSLTKNKSEVEYWDEMIRANQSQIEKLKLENAGLLKSLEDHKMQSQIQRVELENKLISSIEHVEELQGKVNKSQRDVECQAIPRQINKYVGCKPNVKVKETQIQKGDFFDENEERLKVCNIELETTKRQVGVLQEQLINIGDQNDDSRIKERIHRQLEEYKMLKERLTEVEEKLTNQELTNYSMATKLREEEELKNFYKYREKKTFKKMMDEFESFRDKLDAEMKNYKKEKEWLQFRISNLEHDNSELQKMLEHPGSIRQSTSTEEHGQIRKAMSETDILQDDISLNSEDAAKNTMEATEESVTLPQIVLQSQQPFSQLSDVLNVVRSDLEQVLTQIDRPESTPKSEEHRDSRKSLPRIPDETTDIIKDVLSEWAEDERKLLERQLKRSKEERSALKNANDRLSKELQVALAELNVYRQEKPHKDDEPKILQRSHSFSDFHVSNCLDNETSKWKARSGILFREVNRIRKHLSDTLEANNELRYQIAIARGERELSNCFEREQYPLSPSLSYHTANDIPRIQEKDDLIIHEQQEPFQLGSSKASLSCSIMIRSQSAERKSRQTTYEPCSRQRSRSANRKPTVSKEELQKREKRREMRLPKNASRSSSVVSLHTSPKEFVAKLPIMSQSWHEKANGSLPEMNSECDDGEKYRVVSLREKVMKLSRENKELHSKINYLKSLGGDPTRILQLEKETEELKQTVRGLLEKVSSTNNNNFEKHLKMLQDELDIRRQESAMYEKKITEIEDERKEMYLLMFKKGQQAASLEMKDDKIMDSMTEDRITLKFLHDAFYYYLMNRGDAQEHLSVIMTMLGFSSEQKNEVTSKKRGRSS